MWVCRLCESREITKFDRIHEVRDSLREECRGPEEVSSRLKEKEVAWTIYFRYPSRKEKMVVQGLNHRQAGQTDSEFSRSLYETHEKEKQYSLDQCSRVYPLAGCASAAS